MQQSNEQLQSEIDVLKISNVYLKKQIENTIKAKDAEIERLKAHIEELEDALKNRLAKKGNPNKGSTPSLYKINSDIYVSEKYKGLSQVIGSVWKGLSDRGGFKSLNPANLEEEKRESEKAVDKDEIKQDLEPKISFEKIDGKYTVSAIKEFTKLLVSEIDPKKYSEIVYDNRKKRRSPDLSLQEYAQIEENHMEKIELLMEETQEKLMTKHNIDRSQYEDSLESLLRENNQEILHLFQSIPQQMLQIVDSKVNVDKAIFVNCLNDQAEYLAKKGSSFKEFIRSCESPEKGFGIVQRKLEDRVAKKFGVETEDIVKFMKSNSAQVGEPDIRAGLEKLSHQMKALMH